ncbi:MAG TPA: HAMP domain-containing sensor histidine kinase [Anaerovoracaceae bacterium]|nr:HAMP domain-containing sensor histidine kinase [Anaerovoracaceae bacterium]
MKSKRALHSALQLAALLAAILAVGLVVNIGLFSYAVFTLSDKGSEPRVTPYAEALEHTNGGYMLPEGAMNALAANDYWAMLIANETGKVVWAYEKPVEVAEQYTLSEVAGFSRWYLNDYPVKVWGVEDGLFVLGAPKDSAWKYPLEMPIAQLCFWPIWFGVALVCNFLVILSVSVWMMGRWHKNRDAARTEWIAGVSHDIRTPLSMVLGYAASLENEGALPDKQRQQAGIIRRKGEEMRLLIADLNLVSRLEYAMEPLQTERLSMPALLREVVADFLNTDPDEKYPIEVEIDPAAVALQLRGDRALLVRMLNNLISNSVHHNPQGCSIRIELCVERKLLRLTVQDDGTGFSDEQLALLNRNTLPEASWGHGLGLRIVKRIVTVHGGYIRFKNELAGGCSCTVWLKSYSKKRKN